MSIQVPNGLNAAIRRGKRVATVLSGSGGPVGPGIVTAPIISGDNYAGQTLTMTQAVVWDGSELSSGQNWQENGVDIPGATGNDYVVP